MRHEKDDLGFRIYVTDSLKGLYRAMGGEVSMRYFDLIEDKPVDERTPEEIIDNIRNKLKKNSEV